MIALGEIAQVFGIMREDVNTSEDDSITLCNVTSGRHYPLSTA